MKYDKIKTTLRKGRKKALTLLEALLVLGIAAFVINAALQLDQEANNQAKGQGTQQEIAAIYGIVDNIPQSQLSGLTRPQFTSDVVASGQMPSAYVNVPAGTISDPWGGNVTVGPDATAGIFDVEIGGVPQSDCVTLATNPFPGLYKTTVGTIHPVSSLLVGSPLLFGDATGACTSGSGNILTFQFSES